MRHNEHRTMDLSPASDDADAPDPTGPDAPAPRYPHRDRDAGWVVASLSGDPAAFGHLYDAWFDKVYDVALRINRDRDVAAEVAQDAFLSAWRNLGSLEDPGTFGGWLLRIARNGAYNRQRKEQRSQPVDDRGLAVIEAVGASPTSAPQGFGVEDRLSASSDPSRAMEDAELADLVWDAAAALGERDVEVLDLQLRHGLSPAEIGEVVGLNRNAANQLVHRVRKRLDAAIRARVLWRGGAPACPDLDRLLRSAGIAACRCRTAKIRRPVHVHFIFLTEIKNHRNAIAHGRERAAEIGGRFTLENLDEKRKSVEKLCRHIFESFKELYINTDYLK